MLYNMVFIFHIFKLQNSSTQLIVHPRIVVTKFKFTKIVVRTTIRSYTVFSFIVLNLVPLANSTINL